MKPYFAYDMLSFESICGIRGTVKPIICYFVGVAFSRVEYASLGNDSVTNDFLTDRYLKNTSLLF